MTKKQVFYLVSFASIALLSSSFTTFHKEMSPWLKAFEKPMNYTVLNQLEIEQKFIEVPFSGKTFIGFKENIAARESLCQYELVNSLGYLGKYQFGTETLKALGIKDRRLFLQNKQLQEKAFLANLALNKWELRREIAKFSGQTMGGIPVTESGILAAAHLGGVGSVKKFLKTNGNRKFKDGFGTSITEYLREFAGYDTSSVVANKNAKAKHYEIGID